MRDHRLWPEPFQQRGHGPRARLRVEGRPAVLHQAAGQGQPARRAGPHGGSEVGQRRASEVVQCVLAVDPTGEQALDGRPRASDGEGVGGGQADELDGQADGDGALLVGGVRAVEQVVGEEGGQGLEEGLLAEGEGGGSVVGWGGNGGVGRGRGIGKNSATCI